MAKKKSVNDRFADAATMTSGEMIGASNATGGGIPPMSAEAMAHGLKVAERMEQKAQPPSVSRNVHFHVQPETQIAAMITCVHADGVVDLTIFPRAGDPTQRYNIPFSEVPKANHWSWPPRV